MNNYSKHVLTAGQTRVLNLKRESEAVYLGDPMWSGEKKIMHDPIDFVFPVNLTALYEQNNRYFATYYHPHDGRTCVELSDEMFKSLLEKTV